MERTTGPLSDVLESLQGVIRGQQQKLRWILAAYISGRHVLLEDKPGTGKTTMAKALAQAMGLSFKRVQFTPDLLPSDILGVSVYDAKGGDFIFHPGPVFTEILLADEINRSSPRTQSALLEAMAERQVTVEGATRPLDTSFFVIATQNPISFQGTYPLPEAQLDRFAIGFDLGYLSRDDEVRLAMSGGAHLENLQAQLTAERLKGLRSDWQKVHLEPSLAEYAVTLVQKTREHASVRLGLSPRGSMDWLALSKALAFVDGEEFVRPEHLRELMVPTLAHRLLLHQGLEGGGDAVAELLAELLEQIPLPR